MTRMFSALWTDRCFQLRGSLNGTHVDYTQTMHLRNDKCTVNYRGYQERDNGM